LAVSGGDSGGGKTQLLAAVETPAMTVFTGSSPVFPISLCFLFFFLMFFFFLSLFFFSFSSLGSLLSIPILLLSSFSLFLFPFFFSFPFFGPYFCSLFPCTGKTGEREVGAATVQPPQKQPEGHVPFFFHRPVVGHGSEVIQVGL